MAREPFRFAVGLAASLAIVLPFSTAALAPLTALPATNAIANGGFEDGLTGWTVHGVPPFIITTGAEGTGHSVVIDEHLQQSWLSQDFPAPASPAFVLEFYAAIQARHGIGDNFVLLANGAGYLNLALGSVDDLIHFAAFGGSLTVDGPLDWTWHRYTVLLQPALGCADLFIDLAVGQALEEATPLAQVCGPNALPPAPTTLYFGDAWCCNEYGPGPDLVVDEVYFGPQDP